MKKILLPLLIFVLVAASVLIYQHQNGRSPSSVNTDGNGVIQFADSGAESNENKKQIKKIVLRTLDWNTTSSTNITKLTIKYENLKLSTENGLTDFCTLYPTILLILEAPNVSYSGEHPEVMMYGRCQNQNSIAKTDFEFVQENIRISNWDDDEVPDKWRVKHFIFSEASKSQTKNIDVTKYEIISVLGYSIEFPILLKKQ